VRPRHPSRTDDHALEQSWRTLPGDYVDPVGQLQEGYAVAQRYQLLPAFWPLHVEARNPLRFPREHVGGSRQAMRARNVETRRRQMRLQIDEVPSLLAEIWDCLPSECQMAAMSVLARLVARLRQPEELPDEN
jgi:hypothetical protein